MRKIWKRLAAGIMAGTMALGLCSCGKKEVYASKEHIFAAEKVALPEGLDYLNNMLCADEKLYIIGTKSWEEGEGENTTYHSETVLRIVGLDGTLEQEVTLISEEENNDTSSSYIETAGLDADGNLLTIVQNYTWHEDNAEEHYILRTYDQSGQKLRESSLDAIGEEGKKARGEDYYFYISEFCAAQDGTVFLSCNGIVAAVDKDGKFLYLVQSEDPDNTYMSGPYVTGDGRIFVLMTITTRNGDEYTSEAKLRELDTVTRGFGAEYAFNEQGSLMSGNDQYDLLINRDSGLAGYDIETATAETLIDWIKSGFDNTAMESNCTTVLQDGRILAVTHDYEYHPGGGYSYGGDDLMVNILTEQDPATLPDRKLIKLYSIYLDTDIKRQILEFNNTNPEYEIEFTDYRQYMGANWDYDDAATKLNNDMIAGNMPDIIVLNSWLNVESYINKGLLADLYEYIDNDETLNRSDYVESLFTALERNGKLYQLPLTFTIQTIMGKSSVVGDTPGWTMDEFIAVADANPDADLFGRNSYTRGVMLNMLVNAGYDNYVNKETGECSFDSEDFIKALEFSNRFPKEFSDDDYDDDDYWNNYQSQWRDGRTLLNNSGVSRFGDIRQYEQGIFGEPITFKGFPGAPGNGSLFSIGTQLGITSKANNPEGAWNFVRYFLTDEYQDGFATQDSYQFPIKKSSLEKQAAIAKERPYWEDEDGNKEYYDHKYWLGDTQIDIGVNTDEDNERVMELINSTTAVFRNQESVMEIISEEAEAYFEGQKSAEEVAAIIQNRVSTYVAESR